MSRWDVGCVPELAEPELPLPVELCATQMSFLPTLVHLSVALPDLAVAPALVHLPPTEFAALASEALVAITDTTIKTIPTRLHVTL